MHRSCLYLFNLFFFWSKTAVNKLFANGSHHFYTMYVIVEIRKKNLEKMQLNIFGSMAISSWINQLRCRQFCTLCTKVMLTLKWHSGIWQKLTVLQSTEVSYCSIFVSEKNMIEKAGLDTNTSASPPNWQLPLHVVYWNVCHTMQSCKYLDLDH